MTSPTILIPESLDRRLDELAAATRRPKDSFLVEALELYLDEREDLEVAASRLRDPDAEWVDHADVRRELDLD